jgi:ABC-type Mn2+/Zn2+ transport system permease subunit
MNRDQISQGRAALSGVAIFLYFAIFTAWVPSMLARSAFLATASRNVADVIIIVVWGGFFGLGIVALRWTQDRGLI